MIETCAATATKAQTLNSLFQYVTPSFLTIAGPSHESENDWQWPNTAVPSAQASSFIGYSQLIPYLTLHSG